MAGARVHTIRLYTLPRRQSRPTKYSCFRLICSCITNSNKTSSTCRRYIKTKHVNSATLQCLHHVWNQLILHVQIHWCVKTGWPADSLHCYYFLDGAVFAHDFFVQLWYGFFLFYFSLFVPVRITKWIKRFRCATRTRCTVQICKQYTWTWKWHSFQRFRRKGQWPTENDVQSTIIGR